MKGDQKMEYKIIEKAPFKVIGKAIRVSTRDGENRRRIPEFWQECHKNGLCDRLAGSPAKELLGICMEFSCDQEEFSYLIGVKADPGETVPEDLMEKEIPAASWAVFQSVGPLPEAIQKVWERIFSEWFPATGYEHAGGPELEVYPPCEGKSEDYRCEVWIPIIKK